MRDADRPSALKARRLWSLRDMITGYAWQFFLLSRFLEDLRQKLDLPPVQNSLLPHTYLAPPDGAPVSGLAQLIVNSPAGDYLKKEDSEAIIRTLELVKSCCANVGLTAIGDQFNRAVAYLRNAPTKEKAQFYIEELGARIENELGDVKFFHVPANKAVYYGNTDWALSLPIKGLDLISEDLTRAGNCYVFGENTACVFHLMRIMEHCVQLFGKKLKIKIDAKTESWHQIMIHVHGEIAKLKGGPKATAAQTAKKKKFCMAASRLDHVRIAWRNDVMHPKATYDETEALEVMTSVRAFLVSVSDLI